MTPRKPENKVGGLKVERVGTRGAGRPKGVPNKHTGALKEMILMALSKAGGVDYLRRQADENPVAFMSLIGRVLPMQVTGQDGGPVVVQFPVPQKTFDAL